MSKGRFYGIAAGVVVVVAGVMPIETIHGQGGISSRELMQQAAGIPAIRWEPAAISHMIARHLWVLARGKEREAGKVGSGQLKDPMDKLLFRELLQSADRLDFAASFIETGQGFETAARQLTIDDIQLFLQTLISALNRPGARCEDVSHFLIAGANATTKHATVFVRCDGLRRTDYVLLIPSTPQPEPSVFRCGEGTPCWRPLE